MADQNTVIELRGRSTYQPNCAKLARNKVAMARRSLGVSRAEFAALLTPLLGWPVTPDAVERWETSTSVVPPGDVLIAVSAMTPAASHRLGVRSHKFIAAWAGESSAGQETHDHQARPVEHLQGDCTLHLWPHGVAILHLVEELDLPNLAQLAVWRYRSYEQNLDWATSYLRNHVAADAAATYILSMYWIHQPTWAGNLLDTAVRIACAPRVLVDRDKAGSEESLATAEQAERELLAQGFEHHEMRSFRLPGVSIGYASWSGVAYHPLDPSRCLAEDELVTYELQMQSIWAYCDHINSAVEQGRDPVVRDGYGWRYLRAARSRLTHPRPQETGQHRSMREAVLETSGLAGHLQQAIEVLREAGKP
jgi:hypothetical protein